MVQTHSNEQRHVASGPPSHERFPLLDGYRALAATSVVATHVGFQTGAALHGPWAGLLSRLDFGVTVFFLLSGFLLYRPIAAAHLEDRPGPAVRPYLWRRFLRIMPAYWLAVLGAAVILTANHGVPAWRWVEQALFVQVYRPDQLLPGLTQMWSLATEVAFYAFLPVFAVVVTHLGGADPRARLNRQLVALGVLCLVSWGYRIGIFWIGMDSGGALSWLPAYLDWFAVGMALAVVRVHLTRTPASQWGAWRWVSDAGALPGACWLVGLSVLWLATTSVAGPLDLTNPTLGESSLKHALYAVAALFLLLPGVFASGPPSLIRGVLGSPVLRWLGLVSYGIFLWNVTFVSVALTVLGVPLFGGRFALVLVVTYALTVATAAISWSVVERPALRLRTLVG